MPDEKKSKGYPSEEIKALGERKKNVGTYEAIHGPLITQTPDLPEPPKKLDSSPKEDLSKLPFEGLMKHANKSLGLPDDEEKPAPKKTSTKRYNKR